jgi:hypothetical protein
MNDENANLNGNENAALSDETQTSERALPASRSRNGKIARLPLANRQQLKEERGKVAANEGNPRNQLTRLRSVAVSYGQLRSVTPNYA